MNQLVALVPLIPRHERSYLGNRGQVILRPLEHPVPTLVEDLSWFVWHLRCGDDLRHACSCDARELREPHLAHSVLLGHDDRLVLRQFYLGELT